MNFWGQKLSILALVTLLALQTMPAWAPFFAEDGQRLEICTPQGIKVVTFDENGIATEQTGDESSEHCPLMITRDIIPASPTLASALFEFSYPEKFIVSEGRDDYSDLTKHDPFSSRDPPALS